MNAPNYIYLPHRAIYFMSYKITHDSISDLMLWQCVDASSLITMLSCLGHEFLQMHMAHQPLLCAHRPARLVKFSTGKKGVTLSKISPDTYLSILHLRYFTGLSRTDTIGTTDKYINFSFFII